MAYRIDSRVDPPEFIGRSWNTVYPWPQMHEGDSILVEPRKSESARRSAVGFAARHPGWKFTTRREPGGLRIWCIQRPAVFMKQLPVRHVKLMDSD